jgi:hypothetical protein
MRPVRNEARPAVHVAYAAAELISDARVTPDAARAAPVMSVPVMSRLRRLMLPSERPLP